MQARYDGYEVLLYPLEYVGITANPYSANHTVPGVSNSGLYDNGWYQTEIRHLYAPCTMRLVASYPTGWSSGHTQMWVSTDKVWLANGTLDYITIGLSHSDTLYYTQIGTIIQQGTHFYDTGTYGLGGGAHVHMILCLGQRSAMFPTGHNAGWGDIWYSPNAPDTIADFFYIAPTDEVVNSGGYDFIVYDGEIVHHDSTIQMIIYTQILKRRAKKIGKRIYT